MSKHLMIKEARCSFPRLYGTETVNGKTFEPGIAIVLEKEKHKGVIEQVKTLIREAIAGNDKLKSMPPKGDKLCLRKPEREELLYLEGNLILKAGNKLAPVVLCPDGLTHMTENTNRIYSGCYVNIKVDIWGQANDHGRRVNAKLLAVQFVPKAADSFDGSYVSPEEAVTGFDALDDNNFDFTDSAGESMASNTGGGSADEDDLLG